MNKTLRTIVAAGVCLLGAGCEQSNSPFPSVHESRVHILPAWSRDGQTIAFDAINQVKGLYLVDTSGANLRLLRPASALLGCSWSPDSKWLVYSDSGNLYKIKATGDSITQLTATSSDIDPQWSYDGSKILFIRNTTDAYILNLTTDSVTAIVSGVLFPGWHPNGQFVSAQYSYAGQGYYTYFFLAIQPDSSYGNYISSFTDYGDLGFLNVDPEGTNIQHIAYTFLPFGGYAQVRIVDITNGVTVQLTDDGGDFPCYCPDGTKIVYTRTLNGDGGLWIINTDGTGKHRLTTPQP